MSDGTQRRVRLKLGMPSKNGTPQGSRSGSPEVPNVPAAAPPTKPGKVNSRAGSPGITLLSFLLLFPQYPRPSDLHRPNSFFSRFCALQKLSRNSH